jgi:hypothetical protein
VWPAGVWRGVLAAALALAVAACEGDGGGGGGKDVVIGDIGGGTETPPTEGPALLSWLQAARYEGWSAESAVHDSQGPHGFVRVFVNPALEDALAGGAALPAGAAAVKELYENDASTRVGWAVMVKIQADSADGDGWYWYERIGDRDVVDGVGVTGCTGCHAAGRDFFTTPFPLP